MLGRKHFVLVDHHIISRIVTAAMASKTSQAAAILGKSQHIKTEEIAHGKWVGLNMITYQDPTGKIRTWEAVKRTTKLKEEADAVCMIAIFRDPVKQCECVILVRQYRPPLKTYTIEFPAGLIDEGETAAAAAMREVYEETGYTVKVKYMSPATALDSGLEDATLKVAICEVDMDSPVEKPAQGDTDEFTEVLIEPMHSILERLTEFSNNGDVVDSRVFTWAMVKGGM